PYRRRGSHGRMLIEHFINLSRINVFTAADDHVALAIDDEEEAVFISIANVAGVKPTVAKRALSRFRILEIAFENVFAAQDDLTEFTIVNFVVIVIENSHLIPDWQAARSWPPTFIRRIESRSAGRFRQAVTFNHQTVESLFELLHDFRRYRRRTAHRESKLVGLQTSRHTIRISTEQYRQHRRHRSERRNLII